MFFGSAPCLQGVGGAMAIFIDMLVWMAMLSMCCMVFLSRLFLCVRISLCATSGISGGGSCENLMALELGTRIDSILQ